MYLHTLHKILHITLLNSSDRNNKQRKKLIMYQIIKGQQGIFASTYFPNSFSNCSYFILLARYESSARTGHVEQYTILILYMIYILETGVETKASQLKLSPRTIVRVSIACSSYWSFMVTGNNPNTPETEQSVKFPSETQE